ncbi:MAG: hypothetical protein Q8K69_11445 [Bacteroidota bacterium]|nr:hypothetical protein [Bacteroidota bacterium]MDP3431425.1 hypothetical protein [Bacteroidota bacterium]
MRKIILSMAALIVGQAFVEAQENILHLLWEQDQFFEKYLKK